MLSVRRPFSLRRLAMIALVAIMVAATVLPTAAFAAPDSSSDLSGWSCRTYHQVRYGETLSGIARWYGVTTHALAAANGISNPNRIYAGQWLCIPYAGGGGGGGGATYHRVRPGETLSGIARWYGTTVQCLTRVNHLANPNRIYAGQVLRIAWC